MNVICRQKMKETSWRALGANFRFFFFLSNKQTEWRQLGGRLNLLSVFSFCFTSMYLLRKKGSSLLFARPSCRLISDAKGDSWQHRIVQSTNLYLPHENAAGGLTLCCSETEESDAVLLTCRWKISQDFSRTTAPPSSLASCVNTKSNYRYVSVQIWVSVIFVSAAWIDHKLVGVLKCNCDQRLVCESR